MSLSLDLYWSFRSPYSYLATPRLVQLHADYDLEINVRPVLPIAVRIPGFFDTVNPLWPPYLLRDTVRLAEYLGLDYGWPRPDPIVQDFATRKVAPEQPYIYRLTRLGVAAAEHGRGLAFIDEVSRLIWSGRVDGWNEGAHLAEATKRAGLDLAELDAHVAHEAAALDAAPSPRTRRITSPPGIGAYRRWCFRANRSSGRTGSIFWCGGFGSTASCTANGRENERPRMERSDGGSWRLADRAVRGSGGAPFALHGK